MSLPIAGAKGPSREPTHAALDLTRMINLAAELEDALEQRDADALTPELAEEIAEELGVRESHLYVAAATVSEIPCAADRQPRVEVCVGNCQKWGAVALLDRALDVHGRRRAAGQPSFSIVAKSCLDRCADAAVVLLHTLDGTAGLREASVESLDEALSELELS